MILRRRPSSRPERGFTVIELLVTMAILVVLMSVAVPALTYASLANKLTSYANNFTASVQLARSEAIKRAANVKMCRSSNGTSCATTGTWAQGWIVFRDVDDNGTVDSGTDTLLQYVPALASEFKFSTDTSVYNVTFQSTGITNSSSSLTMHLCKEAGSPERKLTLSTTGRISLEKVTASSC